jgi:hypothetical protein
MKNQYNSGNNNIYTISYKKDQGTKGHVAEAGGL